MKRHQLLHHDRAASGGTLTLSLTFGAGPAQDEIDFTEFYDYAPRPDSPGREYAYSVYVAGRHLAAIVAALAGQRRSPTAPGPATEDGLVGCLLGLIDEGRLGGQLAIEENVRALCGWLDAAGIPYRQGRWGWWSE
jgi:hypothetical protein